MVVMECFLRELFQEQAFENSSSAVLLNSQPGEFFETTVGVRQGCLLSPILFNLLTEKIMQETSQYNTPKLNQSWHNMTLPRHRDTTCEKVANNEVS